jgi:hypothetical protein
MLRSTFINRIARGIPESEGAFREEFYYVETVA